MGDGSVPSPEAKLLAEHCLYGGVLADGQRADWRCSGAAAAPIHERFAIRRYGGQRDHCAFGELRRAGAAAVECAIVSVRRGADCARIATANRKRVLQQEGGTHRNAAIDRAAARGLRSAAGASPSREDSAAGTNGQIEGRAVGSEAGASVTATDGAAAHGSATCSAAGLGHAE